MHIFDMFNCILGQWLCLEYTEFPGSIFFYWMNKQMMNVQMLYKITITIKAVKM